MNEKIFKAYDIRGVYPTEIDEPMVERIARAYAAFVRPKTVVVGRDVRLSSPKLQEAVINGLTVMGVNVIDTGEGPTDLLYFAVGRYEYDGGIQVSASHNPAEFNGLKMVRQKAEAISSDTGLKEIKALAVGNQKLEGVKKGSVTKRDLTTEYLNFLATFADLSNLPPLTVVINNNFGVSGVMTQKLIEQLNLPIAIIGLNMEPNGNFPKGRPDPLIAENRAETSQLIKDKQADLAVAFDADGDRCYIADENGDFIEGCHLTALLAKHLLQKTPSQKIIYDPRNVWAVEETVRQAGGVPVLNKAGHTFIKNRMRQEDALFAGEMSGHFYFHDYFYADNGIIPFLLVLEMLAQTKQKVSELASELRRKYFVSGEINFSVADPAASIQKVEKQYQSQKPKIDRTDGLSMSFGVWRLNLRASNTEPLLRLNVEAKDQATCQQKTEELRALLTEKTLENN